MKFFGLGFPELLIILAVVLLIFGPKHLPKLGAALGSTVKNLRSGLGADKNDSLDEIAEDKEEVGEVPQKTTKTIESASKKTTRHATCSKSSVED